MSHFRLHTRTNGKDRLKYVIAGIACILAVGAAGYALHSIGTARAKSRETVELHTGEELEQYLLDSESEDYNLNGSYRLEEDLELGWLYQSIGIIRRCEESGDREPVFQRSANHGAIYVL